MFSDSTSACVMCLCLCVCVCARARVRARKGKCPGFVMVANKAGVRQSPIRKETRVMVGNG
jgi:hypothetical protein